MKYGKRAPLLGALVVAELIGALGATWSAEARANAESDAVSAQNNIRYVARELPNIQGVVTRALGELPSPESRLANGEMLLRSKDYDRAIVTLSEIIEAFPDTASYPDAVWMRAEAYYAGEQYLAARRDYRRIVEHSGETRFESYTARALARLIDVSLRLNEPPEALQAVFDRLAQVSNAQNDPGVLYARGKALFRRQSWDDAARSFAAVPDGSVYAHQARYFQGLVALRRARQAVGNVGDASPSAGTSGSTAPVSTTTAPKVAPNFKPAIDAFQKVVELAPDTPEHQHVIDLAWLAIGRLFYESEQYDQAADAYQKVERNSPEFDTMLYELGWVYVRLGDVERAERSLEVLAISDPGSQYIADGTLLRADLLLRSGAFEKALQLYETVRNEYDPMRARVESFLDASSKDASIYYSKLAQQQLDLLDQSESLPPIALRWAREGEDGPAAFALVEDINQCRGLIRQSGQIIEKLTVVLGAANRVQAFPELAAGVQSALGLANRLALGRHDIAKALDEEEPSELTGEIASVRAERRQLMSVVEQLPVSESQFSDRDTSGAAQWNHVSQELTRRVLEIDQLQASLNALRQMLRSEPQSGVTRDPNSLKQFAAALDEDERQLKRYREAAALLRRGIEGGRAQIGLGDARFQNDEKTRLRFRDLVEREVQLAATGQAGPEGQRIGARLLPVSDEARRYDDQVSVALRALNSQVAQRTGELQQKIDTEKQSLVLYKSRLEALDGTAKDVVGAVAKRNFTVVSERLRNIVLRADVGVTQQAWEVREEEQDRVRSLQSERARQEQLLDEELKEVRDDGVDSAPQGGANP